MSKVVIFVSALFMALGGTAIADEEVKECPEGMVFDEVTHACIAAPTDQTPVDKYAMVEDDADIDDGDEDSDLDKLAMGDKDVDDPDDDDDDDPDIEIKK